MHARPDTEHLRDSVVSWLLQAASGRSAVTGAHARTDQHSRREVMLRQLSAAAYSRAGMATLGTVAAGATAAGVLMAAPGGAAGRDPAPAAAPAAAPSPSATPAPAKAAGVTVVAALRGPAPRFASPGEFADGTVPDQWFGYPSVLPVVATRPGWVQVRLAQRPDGSTAWLRASDVTLSTTPYRIVIDLATTRLALYDRGQLVFSAPAGVGALDDPTPPGQYFVAFTEPPPQPDVGYGPFVLVTSDHSQTIDDWESSGDAVIGIHGPLGADAEIGTTGARISHGCIRLHDQALLRLRGIPAGTPVTILA